MSKTLIFTITTGRSGTAFLADFLAQNLQDARVFHERTAPGTFGVDTPDASDLMQFNNFGLTQKVRAFWKRKLRRVLAEPGTVYVETAHQLLKAGLVENLDLLPDGVNVELIDLQRDVQKTALSLFNRREFENFGWTWLWWLDPRWQNKIVPSQRLLQFGPAGCALWYVMEIRARAAYYQELIRSLPGCRIIGTSAKALSEQKSAREFLCTLLQKSVEQVRIPEPKNATGNWRITARERAEFENFVRRVRAEPEELGRSFYYAGHRLAEGPKQKRATTRTSWA